MSPAAAQHHVLPRKELVSSSVNPAVLLNEPVYNVCMSAHCTCAKQWYVGTESIQLLSPLNIAD